MRIIGEIKHPSLKITVFKHNTRISVKIENAHYEQSYKFPEDQVNTVAEVEQLLQQGGLLQAADNLMGQMHRAALQALHQTDAAKEEEEFEVII